MSYVVDEYINRSSALNKTTLFLAYEVEVLYEALTTLYTLVSSLLSISTKKEQSACICPPFLYPQINKLELSSKFSELKGNHPFQTNR